MLAACGGGNSHAAASARDAATGVASQATCAKRINDSFEKLLECVTLEGVREHQAAFKGCRGCQRRRARRRHAGYGQSYAYVVEKLTAAG